MGVLAGSRSTVSKEEAPVTNNNTFDDYEDDDPDDAEALERYAAELTEAVEALGVPVLEPGEDRD